MRNISVRDAPCWDPNVLNASSANCYCHPCSNRTSAPEQNDEKFLFKRDIESERVHEYHKLQGRPRN